MKIVIVENELYLAQSISAKLIEHGYDTEMYGSVKEAMESDGDVFLLSTNMPGQNPSPLIRKFSEKIIILMVSYINNDTVGEPLKLGAKDYIVKPFMIEELLRKIEHYQEYQELKRRARFYESYLGHMFKEITTDFDPASITTPVILHTNYQRLADKVVMDYAVMRKRLLSFIPLNDESWEEKIADAPMGTLLYLTEAHTLKKNERHRLFHLLDKRDFILSTMEEIECDYPSITLETDSKLYDHNEILTIDDYVKYIVTTFQYKFPDTELSKELGISRKSLWEKRKKYGLFKKK
jgi:DNA-binding NtrC family response regulator